MQVSDLLDKLKDSLNWRTASAVVTRSKLILTFTKFQQGGTTLHQVKLPAHHIPLTVEGLIRWLREMTK